MKYPQLVSTRAVNAISDWLVTRLEQLGVDAPLVYSRLLLSLLHTPLQIHALDLADISDIKLYNALGGGRLISQKGINRRFSSSDTETLKRIEAIESLNEAVAADQQISHIECLIDELCAKLREIERQTGIDEFQDHHQPLIITNNQKQIQPSQQKQQQQQQEQQGQIVYSNKLENNKKPSSPEDPARRYYQAFPALSKDAWNSENIVRLNPNCLSWPKNNIQNSYRTNKHSITVQKIVDSATGGVVGDVDGGGCGVIASSESIQQPSTVVINGSSTVGSGVVVINSGCGSGSIAGVKKKTKRRRNQAMSKGKSSSFKIGSGGGGGSGIGGGGGGSSGNSIGAYGGGRYGKLSSENSSSGSVNADASGRRGGGGGVVDRRRSGANNKNKVSSEWETNFAGNWEMGRDLILEFKLNEMNNSRNRSISENDATGFVEFDPLNNYSSLPSRGAAVPCNNNNPKKDIEAIIIGGTDETDNIDSTSNKQLLDFCDVAENISAAQKYFSSGSGEEEVIVLNREQLPISRGPFNRNYNENKISVGNLMINSSFKQNDANDETNELNDEELLEKMKENTVAFQQFESKFDSQVRSLWDNMDPFLSNVSSSSEQHQQQHQPHQNAQQSTMFTQQFNDYGRDNKRLDKILPQVASLFGQQTKMLSTDGICISSDPIWSNNKFSSQQQLQQQQQHQHQRKEITSPEYLSQTSYASNDYSLNKNSIWRNPTSPDDFDECFSSIVSSALATTEEDVATADGVINSLKNVSTTINPMHQDTNTINITATTTTNTITTANEEDSTKNNNRQPLSFLYEQNQNPWSTNNNHSENLDNRFMTPDLRNLSKWSDCSTFETPFIPLQTQQQQHSLPPGFSHATLQNNKLNNCSNTTANNIVSSSSSTSFNNPFDIPKQEEDKIRKNVMGNTYSYDFKSLPVMNNFTPLYSYGSSVGGGGGGGIGSGVGSGGVGVSRDILNQYPSLSIGFRERIMEQHREIAIKHQQLQQQKQKLLNKNNNNNNLFSSGGGGGGGSGGGVSDVILSENLFLRNIDNLNNFINRNNLPVLHENHNNTIGVGIGGGGGPLAAVNIATSTTSMTMSTHFVTLENHSSSTSGFNYVPISSQLLQPPPPPLPSLPPAAAVPPLEPILSQGGQQQQQQPPPPPSQSSSSIIIDDENLLNSDRTHFRPIKQTYADGHTFEIHSDFDDIQFKRIENGEIHLNGVKYQEFNRSVNKRRVKLLNNNNNNDDDDGGNSVGVGLMDDNLKYEANERFIVKFAIKQNDIACQTEEFPNSDDDDDEILNHEVAALLIAQTVVDKIDANYRNVVGCSGDGGGGGGGGGGVGGIGGGGGGGGGNKVFSSSGGNIVSATTEHELRKFFERLRSSETVEPNDDLKLWKEFKCPHISDVWKQCKYCMVEQNNNNNNNNNNQTNNLSSSFLTAPVNRLWKSELCDDAAELMNHLKNMQLEVADTINDDITDSSFLTPDRIKDLPLKEDDDVKIDDFDEYNIDEDSYFVNNNNNNNNINNLSRKSKILNDFNNGSVDNGGRCGSGGGGGGSNDSGGDLNIDNIYYNNLDKLVSALLLPGTAETMAKAITEQQNYKSYLKQFDYLPQPLIHALNNNNLVDEQETVNKYPLVLQPSSPPPPLLSIISPQNLWFQKNNDLLSIDTAADTTVVNNSINCQNYDSISSIWATGDNNGGGTTPVITFKTINTNEMRNSSQDNNTLMMDSWKHAYLEKLWNKKNVENTNELVAAAEAEEATEVSSTQYEDISDNCDDIHDVDDNVDDDNDDNDEESDIIDDDDDDDDENNNNMDNDGGDEEEEDTENDLNDKIFGNNNNNDRNPKEIWKNNNNSKNNLNLKFNELSSALLLSATSSSLTTTTATTTATTTSPPLSISSTSKQRVRKRRHSASQNIHDATRDHAERNLESMCNNLNVTTIITYNYYPRPSCGGGIGGVGGGGGNIAADELFATQAHGEFIADDSQQFLLNRTGDSRFRKLWINNLPSTSTATATTVVSALNAPNSILKQMSMASTRPLTR